METKFEDSNIALLGSEFEIELRKKRADLEPEWKKTGKEAGLLIWRIEKFNVVAWPKEEYGNFFSGDTYIVLMTKKKPNSDAFEYLAHMWVGSQTTMDEAGTGAYKIVELDDYLNREPNLVYEPQGAESEIFKSYFKNLVIMDGGIETGFKKVPKTEYRPRLLHISGKGQNVTAMEVPLSIESMNSEDCFILDNGLKIYNWRGTSSSSFEKFFATQIAEKIEADRNAEPEVYILEQGEKTDKHKEFRHIIKGKDGDKIKEKRLRRRHREKGSYKNMMKLSDEGGELKMTEVEYSKASLKSEDSFLIDRGDSIFIWLGKGSSPEERKFALPYAQKYLKKFKRPAAVPILSIHEGDMQDEIDKCFA